MDTAVTTAAPPEAPTARRVLASPVSAVRQVKRSATTTPGRLSVIAVGLVILTLLTGLIGALGLQQRQSTIDNLIDHREPLAAAAQQLYRSLSDADATAASAFLFGGSETPEVRQRYEVDLATAGAALARASSDVGDNTDAQAQVLRLNQQLPVYASLVETARTNNRQGFPSGAAYLREASGLMRAKILPAAQELYEIDFRLLGEEQSEARAFPWVTAFLTLFLLVALVATQMYLTRKTNRLINVGLFTATVAVVVGLAWGSVALLVGSSGIADGQRNGSAVVKELVSARIVTLKGRADEVLLLATRGDGPDYKADFEKLKPEFSGTPDVNRLIKARDLASNQALAGEIQAAIDNTDAWLKAHDEIQKNYDDGQYKAAIDSAIKEDDPASGAAAFAKLDANLLKALNLGRQEFLDETVGARQVMTALVPGVVVLALLAAVGIAVGIGQRLREYR